MDTTKVSLRQSFFNSLNSSKTVASSDWDKLGDLVNRFENTKIVGRDRDEDGNHRRSSGRCKSSMLRLNYSKSDSDLDKLGDLVEKLEDSRLGKPLATFVSLNSSKPVTSLESVGKLENSDRDE